MAKKDRFRKTGSIEEGTNLFPSIDTSTPSVISTLRNEMDSVIDSLKGKTMQKDLESIISQRNLYGTTKDGVYNWTHGEYCNLGMYVLLTVIRMFKIKRVCIVRPQKISDYIEYALDYFQELRAREGTVFVTARYLNVDNLLKEQTSLSDTLVFFYEGVHPQISKLNTLLKMGAVVHMDGMRPYIEYDKFVIGPWRRKAENEDKKNGVSSYRAYIKDLKAGCTCDISYCSVGEMVSKLTEDELAKHGESGGAELNPYVYFWETRAA